MLVFHWLLKLPYLQLKFLLPLPLLLIAFGIFGEPLTNQILSRSYVAIDKLQSDTRIEMQLALDVLVTEVEIDPDQDLTHVEIVTTNSVLKKLEFDLPINNLSLVKAAIAQELSLPAEVEILQAGTQVKMQLAVNVTGILAEIKQEQGFTQVEVTTTNSVLKKLKFEFLVTDITLVEAILVQELGLSPEDAKMLISYRVKN